MTTKHGYRAVAQLCLLICAVFFVSPASAQEDSASNPPASSQAQQTEPGDDSVIIAGTPPLTEGMVRRYSTFIEWLLEVPFTAEQKIKMRSILVNDWKQNKPDDIKSDTGVLELEAQITPLGASEREVIRRKLQPEVLKQMRADKQNPDTQWLLGVYDIAHKPIAPGNPPLTRQTSDAFAELACFMIGEVGGKKIEADANFKEAWAQLMKQKYAGFSAEQQKTLGQIPELWATLRLAWERSPEPEREKARAQWRQQLQASLPHSPEQVAAEKAMANLTALAKRDRSTLTAAELKRGADDLETVARELRREGGEQNLAQAAQAEQTARQFRAAANPQPTASSKGNSGKPPSSQEAYARAMAALQARHNSFVMMMNMNTVNHVANMNMIATMSGSPYRYEAK